MAMETDLCPECGVALPASGDCWDRLLDLLAIESRVLPALEPETGKRAHFFAVAAYELQHPSRVSRESLDGLREAVAEMSDPQARPIEHLRRDVGRRTAGPQKVRRTAPPGDRAHLDQYWPASWSVTARDVAEQPEPDYPDAVGRWARATLADLDAAMPAAPAPWTGSTPPG